MGQYWHIFMEKEDGTIKNYETNDGLKLMEHSWYSNYYTDFITTDIYAEPTRIWTVGDYWDDGELKDKLPEWWYKRYEQMIAENGKYPAYSVWNWNVEEPEYSKYDIIADYVNYFVNHDKMEYIDINEVVDRESTSNWYAYHITLLTAISNGEGGGDYYGENEDMIGYWAGDLISSEIKKPDASYTKITVNFRER